MSIHKLRIRFDISYLYDVLKHIIFRVRNNKSIHKWLAIRFYVFGLIRYIYTSCWFFFWFCEIYIYSSCSPRENMITYKDIAQYEKGWESIFHICPVRLLIEKGNTCFYLKTYRILCEGHLRVSRNTAIAKHCKR